MSIFKRILAGVMASAVALSIVACGGKNEVSQGEDGITEVVWYTLGNKQEDGEMVYAKINEKLADYGLKVRFEVIDQGAYNDKMNLVISSGEDYDICFASNWTNNFMNNVQKGAFLDISKYLENENKALAEALPDYIWNGVSYKNGIYGVPNQQVLFSQPMVVISKELVEKYNFDLSTVQELEDLEPMLEVLKNNEKNIYPIRVSGMLSPLSAYESISSVNMHIKKTADKENHVAVMGEFLPETKARYELKKEWFEKGYIRKDAITATNDNADLENGKYGFICSSTYKPGVESELEDKYGREMVIKVVGEPYMASKACETAICAISAKSKNPEAAMKVLEIFNTDKEIYNLMAFGIEGVHYTKIGDNQIKLSGDNKYNPRDAWKYGDQFNAYCTEDQDVNVWEETRRINEEAVKSPITGFSVDLTNIKSEVAQINSIVKEYAYLGTGAGYEEAKYEEFLAKLETAGVRTVEAEVNRQLDEFFAQK